ncbi:hypothetical protein KZZ52_46780 [Dactylosporangium sp. AC04546]|uniref:hypothetical protein n=1 Tax=Dactylosporangium sp. AC04546 TaxID=2862460 RepID=UPI001EE10FEB|nr:hypothetical protein [Dactylosporangium sp. AC04546]WVK81419.1 hypothetical protein KZZ52_46780 [Dactylosporangium sp. AC04546]
MLVPPPTFAVIMLRTAIGTSLGAAPFISSALRAALVFGLGYSDPFAIWTGGEELKQAANHADVVKARITNANTKMNPGWVAEDKDAYLNTMTTYQKELDELKGYLTSTGTALQAVAVAYFAFCVMAVTAAAFIFACLIAVLMAMATPGLPAVKAAAELAVSGIAMVAGAAGKVLTGITAGATTILLAGFGAKMFVGSEPGGVKGADFQAITIDYSPLSSNDYVAPKKELPAPAGP